MSYDLFLRPRHGSLSHDRFREYFGARALYQVHGDTAVYQNPDTGIYFTFDYVRPGGDHDPEDPPELLACPLAFNLNYYRPSCFALEAEPELTALVRAFDLLVHDPQISGMGDGEYTPEGFFRGWHGGNRVAHSGELARVAPPAYTRPEAELTRAWRWNYDRLRRQESLTEDLFVASIFHIAVDGAACTATVWPDGIPAIVPRAEFVLMHRKEFAPGALLWKKPDTPRVPWADVEPLLRRHATVVEGPAFRIGYTRAPADVVEFLKRLPAASLAYEAIPTDKILETEMVALGA